jgi:hypothetical protein
MTTEKMDQIKSAIKAQKWDKSSYSYAIGGMDPFNPKSLYYDSYKKEEIVKEFYKLCETKFRNITHYTTFKNI